MLTGEDNANSAAEQYNAWFVEQVQSALKRHRAGTEKVYSVAEVRAHLREHIRELRERAAQS